MKYDKTIRWAVLLTGVALCFLLFSAMRLATNPRWRDVKHVTHVMTQREAAAWVPKHVKKLKWDSKKIYSRTYVINHTYDRRGFSYAVEVDTALIIIKEVND